MARQHRITLSEITIEDRPASGRFNDMTGRHFGSLLVVAFAGTKVTKSSRMSQWWCICSCDMNSATIVYARNLTCGNTISCGCSHSEMMKNVFTKHGGRRRSGIKKAMYDIYSSMMSRCYRENDPAYKNYGGRGIFVCDRWRGEGGFVRFCEDMGDRPSDEYSIDRIRVNEGYSKDNCRWATWIEQQNNRRDTVWLEVDGVTKPLMDWARQTGQADSAIRKRLKLKWSNKDAVYGRKKGGG